MNVKNESLLLVGIGAISAGIERMSESISVGLILIAVGVSLIYFRGYMKLK